jgi:hypothetical protein
MTAMLAPEAMRLSSLFSVGSLGSEVRPKFTWAKKTGDDNVERKVLSVTDQPVFRSGTFRDSWGIQTTWEFMHIDQMILNYNHLHDTGIFSEIPVRKGHGSFLDDPMNSLTGWHTGLRAEKRESKIDGIEYNYLLASYDIFDEEAAERVAAGDWRNRSAEVGYFLTNAEAEHWPVYQGFAFVDIPAVEGLNGFSKSPSGKPSKFSIFIESEAPLVATDPTGTPTPALPTPANPAPAAAADPVVQPAEGAPPVVTDPAVDPAAAPTAAPVGTPAAPADAEPVPAGSPAPEGSGQHGAAGGVQVFQVNGQPTQDFAAVQAHITSLETVIAETTEANRNDFVSGLARDNKILASSVKELSEFAQELTPAQYAKWAATYGSVPASELFSQHGADAGNGGGTPAAQATGDATEKDRLVGIVSMHRANGMSEEKLKGTSSYKALAQIAPADYPI